MDGLRASLRKVLESNTVINAVRPAGFVFVLLWPIVDLIGSFAFVRFLYAITAILFVLWLLGLLICFAETTDWALGTAFCLEALTSLVYMFRYPSLNNLIYFLLYGVIAFYFLRLVYRRSAHSGRSAAGDAANPGEAEGTFCSQCGKSVPTSSYFCPFCGSSLTGRPSYGSESSYTPPRSRSRSGGKGSARPQKSVTYAPVGSAYASPEGSVAPLRAPRAGGLDNVTRFCGGVFSLIFCILLSLYLLFSLISASVWVGILWAIPLIIICIGCWLTYAGCVRKHPGTTGFSLISGGLVALEIIWIVLMALGMVMGLILIIEFGFMGVGITLVVVCAVGLVLFILYYNGLRRTSLSARDIVRGGAVAWQVSLFSVVLICIGAVGSLVGIFVARWIRNAAISTLGGFFGSRVAEYMLSGLFRQSGLSVLTSVFSIAVGICAVVILMLIRKRDSEPNRV